MTSLSVVLGQCVLMCIDPYGRNVKATYAAEWGVFLEYKGAMYCDKQANLHIEGTKSRMAIQMANCHTTINTRYLHSTRVSTSVSLDNPIRNLTQ